MKIFITKIESKNGLIELEYLYYNDLRTLKLPTEEIYIEYYGNGIGLSSLVSDHIRIGKKGDTLLKQYKTKNWSSEEMKTTKERIKNYCQHGV